MKKPAPEIVPETGIEVIRRYAKDLAASPGVYRMIDAKGGALYVGKAKHLKHRVGSYTHTAQLSQRMARMVSLTASMEFITTQNEAEALLLEANLIKRFMPRYNVLLRDDKSFPYIFISAEHPYPQIRKHRGAQSEKGKYYGPFASALAVNETIALLQKAFLLRPCSDNVFKSRTRPCLQYQIKRCSAPCMKYVSQEEYGKLVEQSASFLSGKSHGLRDKLQREMNAASQRRDYEEAAVLRDRLRALAAVQRGQDLIATSMPCGDVIALWREGAAACVQVFFFRAGQNYGNKSYFPAQAKDVSDEEILSSFIGQFYQNHPPPEQIALSHDIAGKALLEDALSLRAPKRVHLVFPQKGEKKNLVTQARKNARAALIRHLSEHASQAQLLEKTAELFGLDAAPERIEIYDNSHISGAHAVGAAIVAGPEGFIKNGYRKYTIKRADLAPGDDYAMMREVLTRRLMRLEKDRAEGAPSPKPDLILLDGGAGQLSVATEVMAQMGITDISYAAIAKGPNRNAGREQFFLPGKAPFQLAPGDAVLHFLQRLRDEAHRFAIGAHRAKRSKSLVTSELDQIAGIGPSRKKALLIHFGSAREVAGAGAADLESVPGIDKKVAQLIYNHFHS